MEDRHDRERAECEYGVVECGVQQDSQNKVKEVDDLGVVKVEIL